MVKSDLIRLLEMLWKETDLAERAKFKKLVDELEDSFPVNEKAKSLTVVYGNQAVVATINEGDYGLATEYFKKACFWFGKVDITDQEYEKFRKGLSAIADKIDSEKIRHKAIFNYEEFLN